MTVPSSGFARHLRNLREARGLSLRSLATRAGVSPVAIWKWERGDSRPGPRFIPSLAKALEVTPLALRTLAVEDVARAYEAGPFDHGKAPSAATCAPTSGQQYALEDVIAMAKEMIAKASGTRPTDVTIQIDYRSASHSSASSAKPSAGVP